MEESVMLDEEILNEETKMLDDVILTEEVSSKNDRTNRQPRSKDQLIKCQFCPKSFSALRWNTGKRSFQNDVTPFGEGNRDMWLQCIFTKERNSGVKNDPKLRDVI